MAAAPRLTTVEEYLRTPETLTPQELIYGVLRVAESPLPRHQALVADLFRAIDVHVREHGIGRMWLSPLDIIFDEKRALVLQPDLFFISNERTHIVLDRVRGVPDLVVEILSPEPRIGRTDERLQWFAEYAVRECWLVNQSDLRVEIVTFASGRIQARRFFTAEERIESAVLPLFRERLADIVDA